MSTTSSTSCTTPTLSLCEGRRSRSLSGPLLLEDQHDASLVDRFSDELSGDFKKLALKLLKGKRGMEGNEVDPEAAAQALYDAGEGEWGTQEVVFLETLGNALPEQIAKISEEYENKFDKSLMRSIKSEFSGDVKMALLALLKETNIRWPRDGFFTQILE